MRLLGIRSADLEGITERVAIDVATAEASAEREKVVVTAL